MSGVVHMRYISEKSIIVKSWLVQSHFDVLSNDPQKLTFSVIIYYVCQSYPDTVGEIFSLYNLLFAED